MGLDVNYLITWKAEYIEETSQLASDLLGNTNDIYSKAFDYFRECTKFGWDSFQFLIRLANGEGITSSIDGGLFVIGGVSGNVSEDCEPLVNEVFQFFKSLWEGIVRKIPSSLKVVFLYQSEYDDIIIIQIEYPDRIKKAEFDNLGWYRTKDDILEL